MLVSFSILGNSGLRENTEKVCAQPVKFLSFVNTVKKKQWTCIIIVLQKQPLIISNII